MMPVMNPPATIRTFFHVYWANAGWVSTARRRTASADWASTLSLRVPTTAPASSLPQGFSLGDILVSFSALQRVQSDTLARVGCQHLKRFRFDGKHCRRESPRQAAVSLTILLRSCEYSQR